MMASVVSKSRGDVSMQQGRRIDLMNSGTGTPWEDRGQLGLVGAYIKTLMKAFTSPAKLFDEIRRPDATGDATSFAFICGLMWSISELLHTWMIVHFGKWDDTSASPWMRGIILAVLAPFAAVVIARVAAIVFGKLISTEIRATDAPQVLLFNLFAYCLAPSIFAIIPIIGVPIAAIWIFVLMMVAALKKLRLKIGGAIINTLLTSIACAACGLGLFFGVNFISGILWHAWFG
jgi:hypothetical protein